MGKIAVDMLRDTARSLSDGKEAVLQAVLDSEAALDELQVSIDRQATEILVLHSPVSRDLRLVLMGSRVSRELERVGDLCFDICRRARFLRESGVLKPRIHVLRMCHIADQMLQASLQSFLEGCSARVESVLKCDDEVDALNDQVLRGLLETLVQSSDCVVSTATLVIVAADMERIADHATNIAEAAVYVECGDDIRHSGP
jgi:phosphate transport system protein